LAAASLSNSSLAARFVKSALEAVVFNDSKKQVQSGWPEDLNRHEKNKISIWSNPENWFEGPF
jgi:endonuclease YncB( thermonuclease family)